MLDHIIHVLGSVQVLHPLARSKKPIPISYGLHICPMCIHMHMCTCSIQVLVAAESQKNLCKYFLVYVHTHTRLQRGRTHGAFWNIKCSHLWAFHFPKCLMPFFPHGKKIKKSLIFMLCNAQGHKALPESGLPQLCLRFRYCPWHWVTLHLMS